MKYNLDDIIKYVNGELSPEESAQIEEAIRTDEMTRDLYDGYKMSLYDDVDINKATHRVNSKIQQSSSQKNKQWLKIAVACLLAIGTGFWVFRSTSSSPVTPILVDGSKDSTERIVEHHPKEISIDTTKEQVVEIPISPNPAPKNLMAFQQNDELELLIAGVRSDNELRQVIPHNQANIKRNANVQFGFNFEYEDMFLLIVKNNKGEIITEKGMIVNKNKASVNISFLKEGLYYWQIEGEDELLHTGSFIVK